MENEGSACVGCLSVAETSDTDMLQVLNSAQAIFAKYRAAPVLDIFFNKASAMKAMSVSIAAESPGPGGLPPPGRMMPQPPPPPEVSSCPAATIVAAVGVAETKIVV